MIDQAPDESEWVKIFRGIVGQYVTHLLNITLIRSHSPLDLFIFLSQQNGDLRTCLIGDSPILQNAAVPGT